MEEPRVVHVMALAFTIEVYRQREPIAWIVKAVTATYIHHKLFLELGADKWRRLRVVHGSDRHLPFTVDVCFQLKNRQTEPTGRTCSDSNLLAMQVFILELQRRQGEEPRVVDVKTTTRIYCS